MKATHTLASALWIAAAATVHAQPSKAMPDMPGMATATAKPRASASAMTQGEILKVFPKGILLKHGPIDNIGMAAMTMQFGVANPKLLKGVKKGDSVRFTADRRGDQFVVTRLEVAR